MTGHSEVMVFTKTERVNLGSLLAQVGFLSAEQAAKIDEDMFGVILKNIYDGWIKNGDESLSELLGLTGPQIKFLRDMHLPEDLEGFGRCMKEEGFVRNFPDVKKRIFAVTFYIEGGNRSTGKWDLSKEEIFEAAQTLNSLEKADTEKRAHLALEYRDYLKMRRSYRRYIRHMQENDPLKEEITRFGEAPVNIKPSKISDYHHKIGRIVDIMNCSDNIVEYSLEIEKRYKKECNKWEYTDGRYSIIMPKDAYDIIYEGRELYHCVGRAGYIESMAAKNCTILFLRENEKLHTPFITIEVRNGGIKQCYGYRDSINHSIPVRDFIEEYAGKQGLTINAPIYLPPVSRK